MHLEGEGGRERGEVREASGAQILEGLMGSVAFPLHEVGAVEGSGQKRDTLDLDCDRRPCGRMCTCVCVLGVVRNRHGSRATSADLPQ